MPVAAGTVARQNTKMSMASSSSSASSLAAPFKYPDVYHLPPFFTIQPVAATREKQLGMWCDLLARFVRHSRRQSFAVAADAGLVRVCLCCINKNSVRAPNHATSVFCFVCLFRCPSDYHVVDRDIHCCAFQPPFANPSIDRRLPLAGVQLVLDDLVHKGYAEWTDGAAKQTCSVRCDARPWSHARSRLQRATAWSARFLCLP